MDLWIGRLCFVASSKLDDGDSPASDSREKGVAIAAYVFGLSCGALQGGLSKFLTGDLPILEIIWGRYVVLFLIVVPFAFFWYGRGAFMPARRWLHILRALFLLFASITFVTAISVMPLADTLAIVYLFPFVVTALSPVLLNERVGSASWIAVGLGFLGVLVVIRPGFQTVDLYASMAIVTGLFYAGFLILSRRLAVAAPATVTATWSAGVSVVLLSLAMPFVWITPDLSQMGILVLVGGFAAVSQIGTMIACSKTEMPTLAPFGYSDIVAATVVGFLLFGDIPDFVTWIGILIVVASGIFIALASTGARLPLMSRSRLPGS